MEEIKSGFENALASVDEKSKETNQKLSEMGTQMGMHARRSEKCTKYFRN